MVDRQPRNEYKLKNVHVCKHFWAYNLSNQISFNLHNNLKTFYIFV